MSEKVIIVMLRQRPKIKHENNDEGKDESNGDKRSDPFYEFGSFGCTGCHDDHLLNKKNQEHLQGVRLAFAQGGKGKIKLVYLTPPIKTRPCGDHLEAYWKNESPFRFSAAPTLVDNEGGTDFPSLCKIYKQHNRTTLLGKFSSEFRNRTEELDAENAAELIHVYEKHRKKADKEDFARHYWESMECPPPATDKKRKATYRNLRRQECRLPKSCLQKRSC